MTSYGCFVALRVIVLFLTVAATVLALIGTVPVPFYTNTVSGLNQGGSMTVTLWTMTLSKPTVTLSNHTVYDVPNVNSTVRINYAACESFKATFRAMQGFGIGAIVIGFFAFLFVCLMLCCRLKVKLPLFIFLFLAFFCEVLLIILGGVAYSSGFCKKQPQSNGYTCSEPNWSQSSNQTPVEFKQLGYKIGIGYILHVISTIVFFVAMVLSVFTQELWCGKV